MIGPKEKGGLNMRDFEIVKGKAAKRQCWC